MSMDIIVREATEEDIPKVLSLFYQEFLEERADEWTCFDYSHESLCSAIKSILKDKRLGFLLVAEDCGKKILGAILMEGGRPLFNLQKFFYNEACWFVLPEYRGMGIGVKLFEHACLEAERLGANAVMMGRPLSEGFENLDRFYRSKGLKPGQAIYLKDLR